MYFTCTLACVVPFFFKVLGVWGVALFCFCFVLFFTAEGIFEWTQGVGQNVTQANSLSRSSEAPFRVRQRERERERERKRTRGRWWRWKWADVLEIIKDLQPDGCCCHFFLVFLSFFIFSIVLLVPHPHFLTRRSISWLEIFCLPLYFTVFHLDLSLFPCLTCLTEVYNDFLVKIFIGLHEVLLMV